MKFKLCAAVIALPLLVACGGGGSDDGAVDAGTRDTGGSDSGSTDGGTADAGMTDSGSADSGSTDGGTDGGSSDGGSTDGGTADGGGSDGGATDGGSADGGSTDGSSANGCCLQEDRTPPAPGSTFTSSAVGVKDNGVADMPNLGPQDVFPGRNFSFPGLRFGNFLMLNNPWNDSNTTWDSWTQSISLTDNGGDVTGTIVWDWGLESQKNVIFATTSFPELVFGTKSKDERSGTFAETGLPVENTELPTITIDYGYDVTTGVTAANPNDPEAANAEYNVAIESFWHDSCDIVRNGGPNDNQVMEMMVWFRAGERKPSGSGDLVTQATIGGVTYDVYRKSGNFNYVAYLATTEIKSGTLPYSDFINDARENADTYGIYKLKDTDCLANILYGPELWHGAGTFQYQQFQVNRSY